MNEINDGGIWIMKKENQKQKYIFRPYITKNGKRIYPKNSKVFKIPVE